MKSSFLNFILWLWKSDNDHQIKHFVNYSANKSVTDIPPTPTLTHNYQNITMPLIHTGDMSSPSLSTKLFPLPFHFVCFLSTTRAVQRHHRRHHGREWHFREEVLCGRRRLNGRVRRRADRRPHGADESTGGEEMTQPMHGVWFDSCSSSLSVLHSVLHLFHSFIPFISFFHYILFLWNNVSFYFKNKTEIFSSLHMYSKSVL